MKNIAVVLAGCGVYDGSEINEVVLTLLAIENQGSVYQCFAPDINHHHVIDHVSGNESNEIRNVLKESARIVRGNVKPLLELDCDNFDALIVTGGFGVAKNLSTFAFEGKDFSIDKQFLSVMTSFKNTQKVAGYMCIAPVLLPKVYDNVKCTIGNDAETISVITALGGEHMACNVDEIVIDEKNNVVTTPAYMLASSLSEAQIGINRLVSAIINIA